MLPFEEDLEILDTILGVARRTSETLLAEIGVIWISIHPPLTYVLGRGYVQVRTKVPENEFPVKHAEEQEASKYARRSC